MLLKVFLFASLSVSIILGSWPAPAARAQREQKPPTVQPDKAALQQASPRGGQKFALLVGVGEYNINKDAAVRGKYFKDLNGPPSDVADIKTLLTNKNFGFIDDKEHMRTLVNGEATRDEILKWFRALLIEGARKHSKDAVKPTILFYYSGHGRRAKDVDGDEGDGFDETIMPADTGGGAKDSKDNRDIIDDELDDLFEELARLTDNVIFILDSCHSGTGTRGVGDVIAREADDAESLPVEAIKQQKEKETAKEKAADMGNGVLPRGDLSRNERYVTISGSLPHERSYEKAFAGEGGVKRYNGLMTRSLIQILTRSPRITYEELKDELSNRVVDMEASQHPQIEGDITREVFGGADTKADNSIPINYVGTKSITIAAGASAGIRKDSFVAIYPKGEPRLVGEEKKIATVRVTEVAASTSNAEIVDTPKRKFTKTDAVAVLVAPDFGADRLRVALDPTGARIRTSAGDDSGASLTKGISEALKESKMVEVVSLRPEQLAASPDAWDVRVMRGKFGDVFKNYEKSAGEETETPQPEDEVYFLASRDYQTLRGNDPAPLYKFWVKPDERDAAEQIARALEKRARQEGLRRLVNKASPEKDLVKIKLVRVTGSRVDEQGRRIPETKIDPLDQGGTIMLRTGERFQIQIENYSDTDLYVTLFSLGTSGNIVMMLPPRGPSELLPKRKSATEPGMIRTRAVYRVAPPLGVETYKVIATTEEGTDFSFLTQGGIAKRSVFSPLEWLMSQAVEGMTRDPKVEKGFNLDTWTAARIDALILPPVD